MIDHEQFLAWCEDHFDSVKVSGSQIRVNSCFADDRNYKLYCHTEKNAFHCWKSDEHGSLLRLVMKMDKCDYETAKLTLGIQSDHHKLEQTIKAWNKPESSPEQAGMRFYFRHDGRFRHSDDEEWQDMNLFQLKCCLFCGFFKDDSFRQTLTAEELAEYERQKQEWKDVCCKNR